MNENGYEELVELAKFCLVMRIPYAEARLFTDDERAAFIDAYNEIHEKGD